jgi:hypothetical protein
MSHNPDGMRAEAVTNRRPQARTYRDGGSEMRVLLSTYTAGAWL